MSDGSDGRGATSRWPWSFVVVLFLVTLNLRAPFVALAPLADRLRHDLGVGGGAIGVLTGLPVLCFGLLAPVALLVIRRAGPERAVLLVLGAVVAGSLVRSAGGFALAVLGTLVIGLGLTVGNVVVPVLIRREAPAALAAAVTGVYVSAMNIGSMVVSVATVPVADAAGWRAALVVWAGAALVGAGAWLVFLRRRPGERTAAPSAGPAPARVVPWRQPIGWLLALAFAGQATSYYAITAWLPDLLGDEAGLGERAAGAASSVFQVAAIIGAVALPLLALRLRGWAVLAVVGALWMCLPLQLLLVPHAYLLGQVLGGAAQGGGFSAIFTVVVQVSADDATSARLSAFVQGVGYVVAAAGPSVLGVAHDATGAWTLPVLITLATTAAFTVFGVAAALAQRRLPAASAA